MKTVIIFHLFVVSVKVKLFKKSPDFLNYWSTIYVTECL